MATKKTKAEMHEELLKAMSEGEFGMAKWLWDVYTKIDTLADQVPVDITKFQNTLDKFFKEYRAPKDGKDGKSIVGPQGPAGKSIVGPRGRPGFDGQDGIGRPGKKGDKGDMGQMPRHEWDGTKIRFELPNGWGAWVDLRGQVGPAGMSFGPGEGGGSSGGGLERVRASGFVREGVTEIYFGDNLTVTRTGNGVRVDATGGGSGTPAGVLGDVQINNPNGSFGVVSGARIVTTGSARGTNAFDWQGGVQTNIAHVASGLRAIAIGADNTASTADSVAIGNTNVAQIGAGALAVGRSNQSNGTNAISYGISNTAGTTSSIAIGLSNNIAHSNAMGYGQGNQSNGDFAVLFGYSNQAGAVGMAFGVQNTMGAGGLGVGNGNTGGGNGIAFGLTNSVTGNESGIFGMQNSSSADKNYIFGYSSSDDGTASESMSLGHFNALKANNTYIFGNSITNNIANSMMLGVTDVAKIFIKLDDLTTSGVQVGINTLSPNVSTALHIIGLADSGAGIPSSAVYIENVGSMGSGISARIGVDDSVSGIYMGNYANFFSDTGGAGFDYWGNGNSYFGNNVTMGTLNASSGAVSNSLTARDLTLTQATLGNAVLSLKSSATNDDPTVTTYQNRVATTNATVTTLHSFTTASNYSYQITAWVTARRTGGSAGTTGDTAGYILTWVVKNIAGTVTAVGGATPTPLDTREDVAGYDATMDISGTAVRVRVTGVANTDITWHLTKFEVSPLST